jgi:hypothetical protein
MVDKLISEHRSHALDDRDYVPLSCQQARWWYLDNAYGTPNCQTTVRLRFRGRLDHQALRAAFGRLLARHSVLRTRLAVDDAAVRQYVGPAEDAEDYVVLSEHEVEGHWGADQLCAREVEGSLNVDGGPLVHGALLRLPDREYILIMVLHPIVCDNPSVQLLLRELLTLYQATVMGSEGAGLPFMRTRDRYYPYGERTDDQSETSSRERERWRRMLESAPDAFGNWISDPRYARVVGQRRQISLRFPRELVSSLAEQLNVSTYVVAASAWAAVFLKWSRQAEVAIGMEAGVHNDCMHVIGPLQTLAPLRVEATRDTTVQALVQKINGSIAYCDPSDECKAWEDLLQAHSGKESCRPVLQFALTHGGAPRRGERCGARIPS